MKKFTVRFLREFEVEVEAENSLQAGALILQQFPKNATKLLSILPEGYVEAPAPGPQTSPPRGRPNGGGSPGTPVVKQEVLVDQVAKAA